MEGDLLTVSLKRAKGEDAGNYAIILDNCTVSDNYTLIYNGAVLTIVPRSATVTALNQTITEGETIRSDVNMAKLSGQLEGHTLSAIEISVEEFNGVAGNATTKTITVRNAKISDAGGNDVTKNYDISYANGILTVNEKPKAANPDFTLLARLRTCGRKALRVTWTKVGGADGYDVYFSNNDHVFGKVVSVTGALTCKFTGLKKKTVYKACVQAWKQENGRKKPIGKASPTVCAVTGNADRKHTNAAKVTVSKDKLSLKVGRNATIKATVKGVESGKQVLKQDRKLLQYYSSDRNVATVNRSGRIVAVGKGSCTIYVIAANGLRTSVKVRVK